MFFTCADVKRVVFETSQKKNHSCGKRARREIPSDPGTAGCALGKHCFSATKAAAAAASVEYNSPPSVPCFNVHSLFSYMAPGQTSKSGIGCKTGCKTSS